MSKRDYYEVLGVSKDASDAEIKKLLKSWPLSIIRTATRMIRRQLKKSSKKSTKPTASCLIRKTRPV